MPRVKEKAVVAWSSGKDSAWALHRARHDETLDIVGLFTTVNVATNRVAVHSVPAELLDLQAAAVALPLTKIPLSYPCSNAVYERAVLEALFRFKEQGVSVVIFGDLFLDDIRSYRERMLNGTGMAARFPLWDENTRMLAHEMLAHKLRAVLVSVDTRQLASDFAGRSYDEELVRELPAGVDPCGERGEFHTFVYAGPMFKNSITVSVGGASIQEGFAYADVIPCRDTAQR